MAEASMISIFNNKIAAFNKAASGGDFDQLSEIGVELVQIALTECAKANTPQELRDRYTKQSVAVTRLLTSLAQKPPIQKVGGNGGGEEGSDPYYVPKDWFSDDVPNLNFTNIIGAKEVKEAFMVDVIAPLRPEFREVYRKFRGSQVGSQILLYGPPGTGKTHIVKCLAGALNCKIAVVQTSEVLASVVGVAEKNIADIFEQASKLDRCVIFFDEIDAICSDRSSDDSRYTKSILTTLLTCMDGFLKTKSDNQLRIIVAATNLPWKLDSALKRGGRFETQIYVPLPDDLARRKFIDLYMGNLPHDPDVTAETLSRMLDGFSGADIKAVIKQISNRPLRREVNNILNHSIGRAMGEKITLNDCKEVIENYINGVTHEMLLRFEAYNMGLPYRKVIQIKEG